LVFFADKVRSLTGIVMDSFSAIMEQASIEDPKDMNAVVVSEMTISEETVKLVRCSSSHSLQLPSVFEATPQRGINSQDGIFATFEDHG